MRVQPRREDLVELTREWTGERSDDGRPLVPDSTLAELGGMAIEQIWETLWEEGYGRQYAGEWLETNPGRVLVGRAVTAQFVPHRPDFDAVINEASGRESRPTSTGNHNWSVVESLTPGDVMVVDIFGKIHEGTVIGDRLGSAVAARSGTGAVIHGGVRDLHGLRGLDEVNIFYRGTDPTPIGEVCLAGLNIPVRIGEATVLPGDVVLGTPTGVLFIPPHLALRAAERARDAQSRDAFAKQRLTEGIYTLADLDVPRWSEPVEGDYHTWQGQAGQAAG